MAEISIDQSKLPGVKEVCRDFAVLEDHTLAHSLQEQEIEHHLATNVQRNRLVQYDLQMAKQLQEEEDRKARARIQEHHKDLEQQDCEIAQEIQVKLVIEAEQRRRQEEDDEDIARILQQKELQEEKRRKKPQPEAVRHGPYEEGYQLESRDHSCGSPREPAPEPARPRRPRSGDRQTQQPREHRRGPPLLSEGLDLEVLGSSSEVRKARDGRRHDRARRDRNPGSQDKPRKPPSDAEDERVDRGGGRTSEGRGRRPASRERTRGPPSPKLDGGGSREWRERRPRSRERPPRPPPLLVDWEDEGASAAHGSRRHRKRQGRHSPGSEKSPQSPISNGDAPGWRSDRRHGSSCSPNPDCHKLPPHEDRQYPRPPSRDPRLPDAEAPPRRGHRRGAEGDSEGGAGDGAGGPPSSRHGEGWEMAPGRHRNPGTKSRGTKEAIYHKPRVTVTAAAQDLEFYDAEIARKLQEEELLASQVDKRAAQVAQDEEIARLLMAEEKKAYKKAKEREKSSEKRKQDQDWKQHEAQELGGPRSREGHEPHQARSDKPTRLPPPPTDDLDQRCSVTSQHHTARQISKPDPSHKGYHYKQ